MQNNIGLAGEYNLVVTRPDGSTTETGWFKNLILDQGLDRIGTTFVQYGYDYSVMTYNHCQIGTGTTVPDATQTALTNFTAGVVTSNASASVTNAGSPTYASSRVSAYAFAQGAVVGNMSEIGVGWSASGSTLFSRALISDGTGSPTVITLTPIDQLTVYYKLTLTPVVTDGSGSVILGGTTYNYVSRLASIGNWCSNGYMFNSTNYLTFSSDPAVMVCPATTTTLGTITGFPAGNASVSCTSSSAAYSLGSHYRDTTITLPVGNGNAAGGIGALVLVQPYGMYTQYVFTPAIPKDDTKVLSLTFRTLWSRGA